MQLRQRAIAGPFLRARGFQSEGQEHKDSREAERHAPEKVGKRGLLEIPGDKGPENGEECQHGESSNP
jgi:hypothetical protein